LPIWKLTINGQQHQVVVPADTPLLWVIREEIGYKGTKFGCGQGLCGACTVHVAGEPVRSCVFPISAASDAVITTIEGLVSDGEDGLHALQRAWVDIGVPQCGYCQSGQIMAAAGLLAKNPAPTEDEVRSHMAGNICRCGSYPQIRKAILAAAEATAPQAQEAKP
jgi:isoquinoline 1-oxidoreductase alpha subunit